MNSKMILTLGREVMPPGLAEDAAAPLYQTSSLRPAPFLCEADSRILVPSMLAFAAREYHTAGILPDSQSQLFLVLDGTPETLRVARSMVWYASGINNDFNGIVGIWLEVGEEFNRHSWAQTLVFLCEISNSSAILLLFTSAINRPSVKQLIQNLCVHIPGLMRSAAWRYDYSQLATIICAYIQHMGVQVQAPERFKETLQTSIAGRVATSEQAIMLADILIRQAKLDKEGAPYVTREIIPNYWREGRT